MYTLPVLLAFMWPYGTNIFNFEGKNEDDEREQTKNSTVLSVLTRQVIKRHVRERTKERYMYIKSTGNLYLYPIFIIQLHF